MQRSLLVTACAVVAVVIAALSLGLSFAHVLEAPPRLNIWPPELWRETTVFNGQFKFFAVLGGPLDVAAVLAPAALAFALRGTRQTSLLFAAAALFYAVALALWFGLVAPANAIMATWTPGPVPADFHAVQFVGKPDTWLWQRRNSSALCLLSSHWLRSALDRRALALPGSDVAMKRAKARRARQEARCRARPAVAKRLVPWQKRERFSEKPIL